MHPQQQKIQMNNKQSPAIQRLVFQKLQLVLVFSWLMIILVMLEMEVSSRKFNFPWYFWESENIQMQDIPSNPSIRITLNMHTSILKMEPSIHKLLKWLPWLNQETKITFMMLSLLMKFNLPMQIYLIYSVDSIPLI